MAKLVVFRGDAVVAEIHLAGNTVRIGRDSRNDIVLDDPLKGVSRFHAEVRAEAGTYFIVDMKSRNGVWMKGRRIQEKTSLALGVPVTLGAFELVLEDDVSSGEFGEVPLLNQPTMVNAASAVQSDRSSRSATRVGAMQSPATATKRHVLLWSGVAVAVLIISGVTFAVIRYGQSPTIATLDSPPLPSSPPPLPAPSAVGDPRQEATAAHLSAARAAMDDRDYAGALRDHLLPVLELDPDNEEALQLKRQADAAVSAAAPGKKVPPTVANIEPAAVEPETPGIPRRANEAWADYSTRVSRLKTNLQEGNRSLVAQDFGTALARFQSVERDQKGYGGVEALIADTIAKQQKAFDEAMGQGETNERADKLLDAQKSYQRALEIDGTSTSARGKIAAVTERLTQNGLAAFNRAEVFRKRTENARAIGFYKQAADWLPAGHEKKSEALMWLERLKP